MKQVDVLIKSIREWDESRQTERNNFKSLIGFILFKLGKGKKSFIHSEGTKEEILDKLKNRILYLVHEEGLNEDFIVMSVVNAITEELEHTIINHGNHIINNEELLEKRLNETELDTEFIEDKLDELKDIGFNMDATKELDNWKTIVATTFTRTFRERCQSQRKENAYESFQSKMNQIPEKIQEILLKDIPIGILLERISFEKMKSLTVEKAKEIKKELKDSMDKNKK